ncbi:glutamate-rich protein 6 isoform X3 [Simochromis diagramma]|uniref:glutamate-rich protein 6 isoform X3 n=1 Tax=Simochromis diagramma TaxID=43689 RepID=UPI001A7EA9D0|nr:glutamate-rich protein 6 isoform X3 [Simochromis diagramma]
MNVSITSQTATQMRSAMFTHCHTAISSPWLLTTAASLKHRSILDYHCGKMRCSCPKPVSDPPTYCIRAAGVLRIQSRESTIYGGYPVNLLAGKTSFSAPGVFRLRLSHAPGKGTTYCSSTSEKCLKMEEEEVLLPFYDWKPVQFGICNHQVGSGVLQKFYSSGITFLTMFPDGSAQVFYPSGLLAVLIVVTEHNGRVCIVYDDVSAPNQQIRAIFQSDGRATCYHTNGNIWLSLNMSGGRCLNNAGNVTCKWSWGTPTPLQPIFLSLNKTVGVRVLGNKQVFVSFLAGRQQAKFSVGTCCAQGEYVHTSGSSLSKDELLALAAKIRIHAAIQHLHQYLTTPLRPQKLKTTPAHHLQVTAQRLLKVSDDVMMNDSDKAFILKCLQDC